MDQPPTQDEWDEAFSKSHELDPAPDDWGIFAYSDAPPPVCGSGLGSFHWFQTQADLICFVRDYLAWWNPGPSSLKPEEIAAEVRAIVDAHSTDLPGMVERLNDFMRNMWCIDWVGQFRDLCEGAGEFPEKIREFYYDDSDVDSSKPISANMVEEFKECLQHYGF